MDRNPLYDAARDYIRKNRKIFHTPGHKGNLTGTINPVNIVAKYDLTEINEMDSLYEPTGAIKKLEENISKIYDAKKSLISCGGATLGIQTMIALAVKPGEKILMGRNIHVSAINALTLLDIKPVWIIPRQTAGPYLPGRIDPEDVKRALIKDDNIKAVYITSPDYYGVLSQVKEIKRICEKYNIPLLVDNAHGAHLGIISKEVHPIHIGADMCVDSAHKTLPVLTGAAFLHINNEKYIENAKNTMALFGSTSPSYLMMISVDMCLSPLLGEEAQRVPYIRFAQGMIKRQSEIVSMGYRIPKGPFDLSRFTISADVFGYTGKEFYWWLKSAGIEPEMYTDKYVVLIPSIRNEEEDFLILMNALKKLPKMTPLDVKNDFFEYSIPKKAMSLKKAFFSDGEEISVDKALNRVAKESKIVCPPGVPVVMAGEIINEKSVELLKRGGVFSIKVVL